MEKGDDKRKQQGRLTSARRDEREAKAKKTKKPLLSIDSKTKKLRVLVSRGGVFLCALNLLRETVLGSAVALSCSAAAAAEPAASASSRVENRPRSRGGRRQEIGVESIASRFGPFLSLPARSLAFVAAAVKLEP